MLEESKPENDAPKAHGSPEFPRGVEIKFPLVADLDEKVSQAYGLVHEAASDTATVRAAFAIDPKQNIRAIVLFQASRA